jgi:hypothetical protein
VTDIVCEIDIFIYLVKIMVFMVLILFTKDQK